MAQAARVLRRNLGLGPLFTNASLIFICAVSLLPMVWVVSASVKSKEDLYFVTTPTLFPRHFTLANYEWLLTRRDMSRLPLNMWNSLKVSAGTVIIQCITATMAGFAFGRLEFRGRDLLFYLLIMMMFIPRAGGLMALYELMDYLHLRNSHVGLILLFPSAISVALFVMRQNFLGVPRELEEAAIIDGAGTWRLFWDVNLPFVKGGIAVVAIWAFIYAWGEYLITVTMLDFPELETMAVAVVKFRGWFSHYTSSIITMYGTACAANALAMLPVILIFIFLQKLFMRGLTEGILKM